MYTAQCGLILKDAATPDGWTICSDDDIITALLSYPLYQTAATGFILEAIKQAAGDRKEYANIRELAEHIAQNYI